jgi:hypothetical protein
MQTHADTTNPPTGGSPISGAGLIAALALVIALGIGAYAWSAVRAPTSTVPGHYRIVMTDYAFTPSHMTWRVGERVTLMLVNRSDAHPGKPHEFMMGRDPVREKTVFGMRQEDGYQIPFFQGVDIRVEGGRGLSMLMPGGARLTGDTQGVMVMPGGAGMTQGANEIQGMEGHAEAPASGDMHGMEGMEGHGEAPAAGDMHGMEGHAEAPESGGMQGMQGMAGMEGMEHMHGGHEGFMPVLQPVGWLRISFTVPDKPGAWSYGCFQQSGQHFTNGMHGTVTILGSAQ